MINVNDNEIVENFHYVTNFFKHSNDVNYFQFCKSITRFDVDNQFVEKKNQFYRVSKRKFVDFDDEILFDIIQHDVNVEFFVNIEIYVKLTILIEMNEIKKFE